MRRKDDTPSFWADIPVELTNQQSCELIRKYKETGDKKIRDEVIYGNMKLIVFFVRKFHPSFAHSSKYREREDLAQEGIFAAMDAIENFDVSKGKSFSTYLGKCIEFKYDILLRKVSKEKPTYSLNDKVFDDDDETEVLDTLQDRRFMPDAVHGSIELEFVKEQILPLLAKRDRDIFVDYYFNDLSHSELALKYDVTTQRINQRIQYATEKVTTLWTNGITEVDKITRGIRPTQIQKSRIEEGQAILKKYGRDFLEEKFILKLPEDQAKIFRTAVLNYYGKNTLEIAKTLNVDGHQVFGVAGKLLKKLKKYEKEFTIELQNGKWQSREMVIETKDNKTFAKTIVSKFGGKLFLYKYFIPMLKAKERQVFMCAVLDYDDETYKKLAKDCHLELEDFKTILKSVCDRLEKVDFDVLVDLVDNAEACKIKLGTITENKLKNIRKRMDIVERFGGVINLKKYFLPILQEQEKVILQSLYLTPKFDSIKTFTQYYKVSPEEVVATEKAMLEKLAKFDLKEAIAVEQLKLISHSHKKQTKNKNK